MHIRSLRPVPAGTRRDQHEIIISALDGPRQQFLTAVRDAADDGADPAALAVEIGSTCSAALQILELSSGPRE